MEPSFCAHVDHAFYDNEQLLELQIPVLKGFEFWWWDFNKGLFSFIVVVA